MKIAIVDVDVSHAKSVCAILANAGHECMPFQEHSELLRQFQSAPYDMLIVNLQHAEDTNPVQVIRAHVPTLVPILCIAGSTNEEEIVASLNAGANDYLFKPIRHRELVIRILVLLRQAYPYQVSNEQLHFGPYVFEPRRERISIMGKSVAVTKKEFDLALLFFRNVGRPLSRTLIVETVWAGNPPEISRTMDTHVSRVRNKLGLIPEHGFRLSPVYGFGYRLDQVNSNKRTSQSSED